MSLSLGNTTKRTPSAPNFVNPNSYKDISNLLNSPMINAGEFVNQTSAILLSLEEFMGAFLFLSFYRNEDGEMMVASKGKTRDESWKCSNKKHGKDVVKGIIEFKIAGKDEVSGKNVYKFSKVC